MTAAMTPAEYDAYVDEQVADAPPLSEELARANGLPLDQGFAPVEATQAIRRLSDAARTAERRKAS